MTQQRNQTALQKMQQIANRLISNTPQLAKMLDNDSLLKPKRLFSPNSNKKYGSSGVKGNLPIPSQLLNYNKSQMTANDYHQKCKQLTNQLFSQRDKCQQLQNQIGIIKQRFVEREIQYRKIIEQLQDQIKSKSVLDGNDRNRMQNVNELHKQIISNISSIQTKTSKILIQQQSDIRRFFHKKINQIKQKFKQDKINKTEKDHQYEVKEKQMMSQLQWIKNIAHKIDSQNQQMVKKYGSLKSQFDIQQKDKQILLRELLMKKKENAVLKAQVDQYEKLLNEVSREMEQEENYQKNYSSYQHLQLPVSRDKLLPSTLRKSSTNNLLNNSKSSQQNADSRVVKQSRVVNTFLPSISPQNTQKKTYQSTITHLKNILVKQKKKVRDLKNLYMRQIGMKSELEKIIRKLVDDVRQSTVQVQKERRKKRTTQEDQMTQQTREELLQKLLSNQKILTLIYDKTFYSNQNNSKGFRKNSSNLMMLVEESSQEIQRIMQDDDAEGFT